ncbi:uncharacterized protein I303_102808 [Kwoniella dejecticola CBS 10117]|uniref:Zn(2)-C6 fungal-type domain-containing protein n=1 Tax=Kwoniella dejecticola CBS 10117 TaxID=1296121 RepID=A0AAJ8KMM8_9TREE
MPAERRSSTGLSGRFDSRAVPKRTYQACAPCRTAKLRCDLGNPDAPHDPPCRRCSRTHRECIFTPIYGREDLSRSFNPPNINEGDAGPSTHAIPRQPEYTSPTSNFTDVYSTAAPTTSPLNAMAIPGANSNSQLGGDASEAFRFARGEALENPADALRILRAAADADDVPSVGSHKKLSEASSTTQDARWERWQPVSKGLLSAEEARTLLRFYEDHMNPCHPIITPELFYPANLGVLLKEPILVAVMIAIAARYHTFSTPPPFGGIYTDSRCKEIRGDLMRWILHRVSFIAMGQNATIGIVEALLILSEWPPEPATLIDTGLLDVPEDGMERSSPCKLYDDVSWALTGMAVRVAQRLDLQDERTYLDPTQPEWVVSRRYRTWTNCLSADRHASVRLSRASLMQEMSTSWYRTISGIGYLTGDTTFPLPKVHLHHREIFGVVELTHIIGLLQELLYVSPEVTQELIKTARFESTLHRLKPELDSLWQRQAGDLPSYPILDQSEEPFTPDELRQVRWRMDHDYVKLYANSIAMRASQNRLLQRHKHKNRQDRVFQANVIQSSEGSFIIEAVDAAISMVKCGVAMERKGVLKYCPTRVFLRVVFASVFLMKVSG